MNGPFLMLRPTLDLSYFFFFLRRRMNLSVGIVGFPGPAALGEDGRRRAGVTAALGASLTTTQRVIHRVHGGAAHLGTPSHVTPASRLAQLDVLMVRVADAADRRAALDVDAPQLARGQLDHGVVALARLELSVGAGRAAELATAARLQLDVVDHQADRDVGARRMALPGSGSDPAPAWMPCPTSRPSGRQDVALLAVRVPEQRDVRRAVRIVLDRLHATRHALLVCGGSRSGGSGACVPHHAGAR